MAITTQNGFVAAMASAQRIPIVKASLTAKAAGSTHSLWKAAGTGGQGATPTSGASGDNPTSATTGAITFTNGGAQSYLMGFGLTVATVGSFLLYDRLWQNSGLSGTSTSAQSLSSTLPARETGGGAGVEAWLECYTQLGGTGVTATLTYVGAQSGGTLTATCAIPATMLVGQSIKFNCAEGVASVSQVQLSATTGTAGDFGIVLRKLVGEIGAPATNTLYVRGPFDLGMGRINSSACLELVCVPSTTNTGSISGSLTIGNG